MILEDIYALLENSFDFVLGVDGEERVVHASPLIRHAPGPERRRLEGQSLDSILTPESLQSCRAGMAQARESLGGMVVFALQDKGFSSLPLRAGYVKTDGRDVYLLFGAQLDSLSTLAQEDKDERIKELACLYTVAEWIESSTTIKEFFTLLPDYLRAGMRYPDRAVVYSVYQGLEYGGPLAGSTYLRAKLIVNQRVGGEIRVGYDDSTLGLLPEEQRMLDEIARMLSVALERKELSERLVLKQEEEASYRNHLADLERQITARTRELDEQRDRLGRIDSYLDRVNQNWEQSKTYLATILKGMPDPVALIDLRRTLVMTNREHVQPGDKCHKTLFNNDTPCQDCRLARIVREKTPITLTIEHDGRQLEVHALPIFNREHAVEGIMEFYRDVTLERTYEQQLRQADRLASLGQLVSGIGHEINNPNQFIRGNVKILQQAFDDLLPILDEYYASHPELKVARLPYKFFRDHVTVLVNDMGHGSERIKGIVEGLKRFARRDEGLLIDNVDLNTVVEACTRLVHNEVHKRAEIELELEPDLPTFTGNSQKVEQVPVNLIVNAAQAIPDDRRGRIVVRTAAADGHVAVEVSDNGKGMNEKTLKQIFDPFFTTKRATGGTGLGLAIAFRIVEEHQGSIGVQSKVGEGTTFTVRIPVAKAVRPGAGGEVRAQAAPPGEGSAGS
ncbi:MAG: ATP-binding protein [Candidatus Eisenbacteria bacterium]